MTNPSTSQDNSAASTLPWLGDLLPFDVFLKTANYMGSDREYGTPESQALFSEHMEVLDQTMQGFIAKLLDGGHLKAIENTERRGNRYANTWNDAVAGVVTDWTLDDLAMPVARDLLASMSRVGRQIVKDGADQSARQTLLFRAGKDSAAVRAGLKGPAKNGQLRA